MTRTHTYSILEVPTAAYTAVRELLEAADYGHAFHASAEGEVIDMHGIALRSQAAPPGAPARSMTITRRTLIERIDRRIESLVHTKADAVDRGFVQYAAQLAKMIDELQWVITTIDEME